MNRGTKEGTEEEKIFCEKFNREELNLENTDLTYSSKIFAVHSTKHQYSSLSHKKVKPKSDCFLIKDLGNNFEKNKNFYISESELKFGTFEYIKNSGISIKNKLSKNYQIHKFGKDSFEKIFKDTKLFIGIIIYCQNDEELFKNNDIYKNTNIAEEEFLLSFQDCFNESDNKKEKLRKIKRKCIEIIKTNINTDEKVWDVIFSGKGCFEDPFYSTYFFQNNLISKIDKNTFPKFSITNGSGRSKGNYTLVIKP
tara:strand:- start:3329 stop:4087 length:759 start_codon:yes stop_codon:yes gene_type:complete